MADKIKLDKDITIRQVLDLTKRGLKGTLRPNIEKAGLSLDEPFSKMRSEEFLKNLNRIGKEGNFTELTSAEIALRELFNISDDAGEFPFGSKGTFVAGGKARSKPLGLEKADQARKATQVELPSIKEINVAIHRATLRLANEGNVEAAALLQVKHHTGLRTTDIVNLTVGTPVQGAKYGTVVRGSDTLAQISNKGDRTNFRLSSMPMGILQDLAEKNAPDDPDKSVKIFKTSQDKLNKQINNSVRKVFKDMNLIIRDQDTGKSKEFTIGLLRKNVFSSIDDEYGAGVANRVLGHSTKQDVGINHYKVTRTSRQKLDINTLAAENFNSTYLTDIGQSNPQSVMEQYKFNKKFFPTEPVVKLTSVSPVQEAAQKTGLDIETKSVGVGVAIDNVVEDNDKSINRLTKQIDQLTDLTKKVDELKGKKADKTPKFNEEMINEHKEKVNDLKSKSKGNLLLSTAILLTTGSREDIQKLFDDPTDTIKDIAVDTAATALLGPTGGLAVVEALRPSPAQAAERTGDEKPATQEELMRPVEKKALEGIADDERDIQEQMNITQMGEGFSREAERKSQLSLDQQMQILQQGR
jgi:hypothetical protein